MSTLKKQYKETVFDKLNEKHTYKSTMMVPKLVKVVLNRGIGEVTSSSKVVEQTVEQMHAITGQKPVLCRAKKSVSNFKIREGQVIGCKVTLRGDMMYEFLTKFINICLPKIKDFRGLPGKSFDGRGNYTIGIKEDIIFPEVNYEKVDRVRGFDMTFVTTAATDQEAYDLLELCGFPFRK
jgi:large subunit ribosomal protein L5